jgi:hypothetical protein
MLLDDEITKDPETDEVKAPLVEEEDEFDEEDEDEDEDLNDDDDEE